VTKKRSCAYCDGTTELTNEHVIPYCYIKTLGPTIAIVKTATEDKAIQNAQEIGDVCAVCNNGPLSLLDTYLALLSQKYFSKIVRPGDRIRLRYDFHQLLRLVLKLGYNVARTRGWPLAVFKEARPYILGREKCPPGLHLFLQPLIPTPEKDCKYVVPPGTREIPPLPWHAELRDVSSFPGLASEVSISFMSYRFFIVQEDISVPSVERKASLKKWLKENKGTHELIHEGYSVVHSSSVTVVEVLEKDPAFEKQLAKAKELKTKMARR
jgi:hypothetical protein